MPRIDVDRIEPSPGSNYPPPFDEPVAGRWVRNLGQAIGVSDFVANHVTLPSGSWSSQRHWHEGEDELVVVLAGEAVLIDDQGRHVMRSGDVALFRKGDGNGHHLVNESGSDCVLLAVSRPERSTVHYSDIDLRWSPESGETHEDGTPY